MGNPPWIETTHALRLAEGAAPDILAPNLPAPPPEADRRPAWLARLAEAFPPGGCAEPVQDWAGVSRRLTGPTAGEHRIQTAPSRIRALGMLAAGVADGWLPLLVVDLTTGEGWRATLWCGAIGRCGGEPLSRRLALGRGEGFRQISHARDPA